MCGIFGYAGLDEIPGLLELMADYSYHRGPDDQGYYANKTKQIFFGLRRLSIIDLQGGHQPIANENRTIWVACNGEVYNYIELKKELIQKGHRFSTNSDVEVLVHLYEDHGLRFLDHVNGMFGIALFDAVNSRFVLARDRLGIKPVYYAWDGSRLAFSSELKSVLCCPWISRDIDREAVAAYLRLFYVPAPNTGLAAVKKLDAGTMAVLASGTLEFVKYWDLDRFLDPERSAKTVSFEEGSDHLLELLTDSCRLELRSDVPVGAFLSGGTDSSAVVALASQYSSATLDTYTVFWEGAEEKMDERAYARSVASRYGCNYHEVGLSLESVNRYLPLLSWHLDEPNADGAFVPTFVISQLARPRSKVILTGAGGDELFGGYAWYGARSSFRLPWMQVLEDRLIGPRVNAHTGREFRYPWWLICRGLTLPAAAHCDPKGADLLNCEMAYDCKTYLKDNILMLTDKMTMASSIEARVPLLDHRIVEFVLGLPSRYKMAASDRKVIFKNAVKQYLPHEIMTRRKDGFGAPVGTWMRGEFKKLCLRILQGGELCREGFLDGWSISRLGALSHLRQSFEWSIWVLLNLELWYRFTVQRSARPIGVSLGDL